MKFSVAVQYAIRCAIPLLITFLSNPVFACVIGSAKVEDGRLEICLSSALGNYYRPGVNNHVFLELLSAKVNDPELAKALKLALDLTTAQVIEYFRNELNARKHQTDVSANDDKGIPGIEAIARIYNDHYKYTDLIAAFEAERKARLAADEAEQKKTSPIRTLKEIDQLANSNSSKFDGLEKSCSEAPRATNADLHAFEIKFSDGTVGPIFPTYFAKPDGENGSGQLYYLEKGLLRIRKIIEREGKLFWVAKDGKEWELTINKVSVQRLTQLRPLGSPEMTHSCYASKLYQARRFEVPPPPVISKCGSRCDGSARKTENAPTGTSQ